METIDSSIVQAFPWSSFFLIYFTLGCPITLQYFFSYVFKLSSCIKSSEQMQSIVFIHTKSTDILFNNCFSSANVIRSCQVKTTFSLVNTTLHFPTFEDKGRLHAYHNKIRIDHCRDNPFQARLSEIAVDRDRT